MAIPTHSIFEAIYDRARDIIQGDTEPLLGLYTGNTSPAYLYGGVIREDEPKRTRYYPHIDMAVRVDENHTVVGGTGEESVLAIARVTLRIVADRDIGSARLNEVSARLRYVFDNAPPSTSSGWRVSAFNKILSTPAGVTGKEMMEDLVLRVVVSSAQADTNASAAFRAVLESTSGRRIGNIGFGREVFYIVGMADALNIADAYAAGLPSPGQLIDGVYIPAVERVETYNQNDAKFIVTKQAAFSRLPRIKKGGTLNQSEEEITVPNWTRHTAQTTGGETLISWSPTERTFKRAKFFYVDTNRAFQFEDGVIGIQEMASAATGKVYNLRDKFYVFMGVEAREDYSGYLRVESYFWSNSAMRAIPAGTIPGFDVDLPELLPLQEYVAQDPLPGYIPQIVASPMQNVFVELGNLQNDLPWVVFT